VKKPSVVCEALFKPLWESAFFADFHQRRQFPQAFLCLFFLFLCLFPLFPRKISRQDRLATTIAHSVDQQHPRCCPFIHPWRPFFFSSVRRKRYDSVPVSMMWAWSVNRIGLGINGREQRLVRTLLDRTFAEPLVIPE
jgi:hypothetical protein